MFAARPNLGLLPCGHVAISTISNRVPDVFLHGIGGMQRKLKHAIQDLILTHACNKDLHVARTSPILFRQCWTDNAVNFRGNTSPRRQLGAPGHSRLTVPRVCGHARAAQTRLHTGPDI